MPEMADLKSQSPPFYFLLSIMSRVRSVPERLGFCRNEARRRECAGGCCMNPRQADRQTEIQRDTDRYGEGDREALHSRRQASWIASQSPKIQLCRLGLLVFSAQDSQYIHAAKDDHGRSWQSPSAFFLPVHEHRLGVESPGRGGGQTICRLLSLPSCCTFVSHAR